LGKTRKRKRLDRVSVKIFTTLKVANFHALVSNLSFAKRIDVIESEKSINPI
jgi:hypothetical protein